MTFDVDLISLIRWHLTLIWTDSIWLWPNEEMIFDPDLWVEGHTFAVQLLVL